MFLFFSFPLVNPFLVANGCLASCRVKSLKKVNNRDAQNKSIQNLYMYIPMLTNIVYIVLKGIIENNWSIIETIPFFGKGGRIELLKFSTKGEGLEIPQAFKIGLRGFCQGISFSFSIRLDKKNAKAIEFLVFLKISFSTNKKIKFCLKKKRNVLLWCLLFTVLSTDVCILSQNINPSLFIQGAKVHMNDKRSRGIRVWMPNMLLGKLIFLFCSFFWNNNFTFSFLQCL